MTDEEIERFIGKFENATLPRSEWTHGKHLVVALVYLVRHPEMRRRSGSGKVSGI